MKKILKRAGLITAVLILLMQVVQPSLQNPTAAPERNAFATNPPPAKVATLLRAACYDCHSNETKYPWYSQVSPVSWWLVQHIKDGRRHLNFSDWPHDNPRKARSRWQNVRDEIEGGGMPLKSYTLIHRDAILSEADRKELAAWADQQAELLGKGAKGE